MLSVVRFASRLSVNFSAQMFRVRSSPAVGFNVLPINVKAIRVRSAKPYATARQFVHLDVKFSVKKLGAPGNAKHQTLVPLRAVNYSVKNPHVNISQ